MHASGVDWRLCHGAGGEPQEGWLVRGPGAWRPHSHCVPAKVSDLPCRGLRTRLPPACCLPRCKLHTLNPVVLDMRRQRSASRAQGVSQGFKCVHPGSRPLLSAGCRCAANVWCCCCAGLTHRSCPCCCRQYDRELCQAADWTRRACRSQDLCFLQKPLSQNVLTAY